LEEPDVSTAGWEWKLEGRTVVQKLLYFCGRKLDQPTGHTAYFYGPYSDDFDSALKRGVLAEDLSEQIERIADWHGGQDAMKHVYTLTQRGIAEAKLIADSHKEEAAVVNETVATIADACSRSSTEDFVRSSQDRPHRLRARAPSPQERDWTSR
jgi:uncharacterized protein YwgA